MRRRFVFWLGLLMSAGALYLAVRRVDLARTWEALASARYVYVLPVVVLQAPVYWLRALRWRVMLTGVRDVGVYPLFRATLVGVMANNVLPARIGEIVRAYALGRTERLSKSSVFATVVLERIVDVVMVLVFFWAVLLLTGAGGAIARAGAGWLISGAYVTLGATFAVVPFLVLLKVRPDWGQAVVRFAFAWLPAPLRSFAEGGTERFAKGLSVLGDARGLLATVGLSFALWVLMALAGYPVFLAFDARPPLWSAFIVLTVTSLGVILPSSPGFVGTFHFFCVLGLSLIPGVSMTREDMLSYAILVHAAQYVPTTLVGLYYLRRDHLSLRGAEQDDE